MTPADLNRPELLAPAGDWEAMRAAVANGADAVYFGLPRYSARQRATNFTREELPEVMRFLRARNVRGYVAFNTLVLSDELPEAVEWTAAIAAAGADAVIVQDLGLARLIHRMVPSLPIHASTQMTLTEPRAVEFIRGLGVKRVILARELSLAEIRRIRQATSMPLEVFVHGALCMSYSGQCLASEALWGRSANRGVCGQACRLPYRLVVDGHPRDLGDKTYLLSTKDLAAYDRVDDLARLGVAGLKIEGRLKSAHYVAAATRVYRAAIDAAVAGRRFSLSPEMERGLVQSYSRGFTHGFLDGVNHLDLVHGRFPKSRGVCVGTVTEKSARGVVVTAEGPPGSAPLKPGDGVVFDDGRPDQDEQGGRVFSVEPAGDRSAALVLTFGAGDVNLAAVTLGSTVWKTDDPRLRRDLEKTYARTAPPRRVPLTLDVWAAGGQPLRIRVTDDAGHKADVSWPQPLERARNRPLTPDLVREQFGRLGETPFEMGDVRLFGADEGAPPDPVMVPKSVLNDLRRQAVEAIMRSREAGATHAIVESGALDAIHLEIGRKRDAEPSADLPPLLYVLVRLPGQLDAALDWTPPDGADRPAMVYGDFPEARQQEAAVEHGRRAGMPVGLATPRIAKPDEEDLLERLVRYGPDAVLVRNLGGLSFLRERAPHLPRVGDFSLNVANEVTADLLKTGGLARVTASLDLSLGQLEAMVSRAPAAWFEAIAHGPVPMLHMEHCLTAAHLAEAADADHCGRRCSRHAVALRDRQGVDHPLVSDAQCRSTLFSGHVQSAAKHLPAMVRLGLRHFRMEFVTEPPHVVTALLDLYTRLLVGQMDAQAAWRELRRLHRQRVTPGTWDFR